MLFIWYVMCYLFVKFKKGHFNYCLIWKDDFSIVHNFKTSLEDPRIVFVDDPMMKINKNSILIALFAHYVKGILRIDVYYVVKWVTQFNKTSQIIFKPTTWHLKFHSYEKCSRSYIKFFLRGNTSQFLPTINPLKFLTLNCKRAIKILRDYLSSESIVSFKFL